MLPLVHVVIQLTHGSKNSILKYVTNPQISEAIKINHAPNSEKSLKATQSTITQIGKDINVPIEAAIINQKNLIEVYVNDKEEFELKLSQKGKKLPNNISIIETPLSVPSASWYGGLSLSGCTAGFSVKNFSNTRYLSTAGHCTLAMISPFVYSNVVAASWTPNSQYDFMVIDVGSGNTVTNRVVDNIPDATPYYRQITSYGSASVGSFACKYGKTTGYTCGNVTSTNYTYNGTSTWYRIENDKTSAMACAGDSGGPVYYGSKALGLNVAAQGNVPCNGQSYYVIVFPALKMTDLGYSPLLVP